MRKNVISQKLKAIIILLCVCVAQIIIPNTVYGQEYTYEIYSKESSVSAVGASYRGRYKGANIKKIELVAVEHKYEITEQKNESTVQSMSGLTYNRAKEIKSNPSKYFSGAIVGVEMVPGTYNYGDNEYKRYKVICTSNTKTSKTTKTNWTTELRRESNNVKILDTRYKYRIITDSLPAEITRNGEYITKKDGDGKVLETESLDMHRRSD